MRIRAKKSKEKAGVSRRTRRAGSAAGKQEEPRLLLRLELRSDPNALSVVRATMERVAEVLHFPAGDCRAIVRAVDEALANVIEHAYGGQGGLPIALTCNRVGSDGAHGGGEGLEVILEDRGKAAKETELRGRALDDLRPGGLGLHFIRSAMDGVEFTRNGSKNRLRLVKYRHPIPVHSSK